MDDDAGQIGSAATEGECRRTVLCAYQGGTLLIGLTGKAIAGVWRLAPIVGLRIAAVAIKEGAEAWRGRLARREFGHCWQPSR